MGCSPSKEADGQIEELKKEVTARESTIAKLKADLDQSIVASQQEEKVEGLTKERDSLKAEVDSLTTSHQGCSATISTLEQSNAALTTELSALRTDIDSTMRELEVHKQQKADLEVQLQTAVQANSEAVAELQRQIAQQTETIAGLTGQLASMQEAATSQPSGGKKHRDCLKMSQKCRIGMTGKYYCGKRMKDEEDICGPLKGSNCQKCQQLDIESRDLPQGFLVNGDGRICRRGGDGVNWFCGGGVMQGIPGCDGYCGPTNGPNCQACQEMLRLVQVRYLKLV